MDRLRHDVAFAAALHILAVFNLRDEEKNEVFGHVYQNVKASLEAYDQQSNRMMQRLKPSGSLLTIHYYCSRSCIASGTRTFLHSMVMPFVSSGRNFSRSPSGGQRLLHG